MKWFLTILLLAAIAGSIEVAQAQNAASASLQLVQTIPLNNVEGRIDHFAVDLKNQRLFMSALGNNTLEVFDLREGKRIHTIAGLSEPQGVCFVPDTNQVFVANGEGGAVKIYDASTFQLLSEVKFSDDADNLRYDSRTREVYVGYGGGALGIIDAQTGKLLGDIKLPAHPESFQLEKSGPRIFINLPNAQQIAVIDREKRAGVARWPLGGNHANFPMALDEANHRLLVACRQPPEVWVFDTQSGKVVAKVSCAGDADDLFYDAARRRAYVSGGEGFISVIEQVGATHFRATANIPTAPGARTSYFVPDLNRLYLAVPHRGSQQGELRVYRVLP